MTDTNDETQVNEAQALEQEQLEQMKETAKTMGISFHPSIGIEALSKKIAERQAELAKIEENHKAQAQAMQAAQNAVAAEEATKPLTEEEEKEAKQLAIKKRALALVRIRVSAHDPSRSNWEGEYFTVGNSVVGSITRYVPYDNDWHAERMIVDWLKERTFTQIYYVKNDRGMKVPRSRQVKMFAVEELPPLTEQELKDLAQRQAMAGGTANQLPS